MEPIKPQDIELTDMDGETRKYRISRIPATYAREIIVQYPTSAIPKAGDYGTNEAMMLKLMNYVWAVTENSEGSEVVHQLKTRALVDNHVPDFDTLARLELQMLNYNSNFFNPGKVSKGLKGFGEKLIQSVIPILTNLSQSLSQNGKQH